MFKCSNCQKVTQAREPMHKVVVRKRDKFYRTVKDEKTVVNSKGFEIVEEQNFCGDCYDALPAHLK